MSKPATAYFCECGHLIQKNPKSEYGELDLLYDDMIMCNELGLGEDEYPNWPKCSVCGSQIIKKPVTNWHEGNSPIVKIGESSVLIITPAGREIQTISIFDISSL